MDYYSEALKLGLKQYKDSVHRSEYPYLPVMDEMLPVDKLSLGRDIGLMQIPIELIRGTKTAGRTRTFAGNFMPIAPENSEFASKWKRLCTSHLEEGIHDPIRAYEYMNRYYVEEGNKRVSVLKYFGAVRIPGEVIRILPDRDGSEEVELYYEFVDFHKLTGINFLEFHKRGSYRKFLKLLDRENRECWDGDAVRRVNTDYYYFRKAFRMAGGERLGIEDADAWLSCISLYGYDAVQAKNEVELKELITRAWKELVLATQSSSIDIIEDPGEPAVTGFISKIITIARPSLKAAFLYRRSPAQSNWVLSHEEGRCSVQNRLASLMDSWYLVCGDDRETEEAIRQAVADGADVIFATSAEMLDACLKAAIDCPKANILNCSLNVPHKSIRMYYPRTYETRFISGAIAGALSENGKTGYVCNYPIYGNIADINAFARGVQLTNAHAKVYLEWSEESSLEEKVKALKEQDIRLISVRDVNRTKTQDHILSGLLRVQDDGTEQTLVTPLWNWDVYYELILKSILDGSFKSQEQKTDRSLNYYWGMSSDVVGIRFSDDLPDQTRYLGELIRKAIRMGVCKPFYRPQPDEHGSFRWHDVKSTISMEEIVSMDWLESNVIGQIPSYAQLSDKARRLVDVMGVPVAREDPEALL